MLDLDPPQNLVILSESCLILWLEIPSKLLALLALEIYVSELSTFSAEGQLHKNLSQEPSFHLMMIAFDKRLRHQRKGKACGEEGDRRWIELITSVIEDGACWFTAVISPYRENDGFIYASCWGVVSAHGDQMWSGTSLRNGLDRMADHVTFMSHKREGITRYMTWHAIRKPSIFKNSWHEDQIQFEDTVNYIPWMPLFSQLKLILPTQCPTLMPQTSTNFLRLPILLFFSLKKPNGDKNLISLAI